MRLICGLLQLDGSPPPEAALDAMAAAMTAPGLTPAVTRRREGALGLAVVDFTGRGEGLVEHDGWIVAADMRLDRPAGQGEAVFADAARRHGRDFPDRVDGDFAVALWCRDAGELWLGRDFIGVRPLAWTLRPGKWFAFASLPKGLHGAGLASPAIDPGALGVALRQSFFRGSDSGFAEIAYLPAGHSLRIRADARTRPQPHRAFRPDPARVGSWRGTADEAAGTLRRLLEEAVARRLPADGPVACHLSGGLDSSAVTVLAARQARPQGGRVLALSMTTEQAIGPAEFDERPLIAAVLAQEPDIDHVVMHDGLRMPGQPEDPDWPGSRIGGYDDRMLAEAAAYGAGDLLSGVGGDEGASYNGANLYAGLLRQGRLRTLARELPARARRDGIPLARAVRDRLLLPLLPEPVHRLFGRRGAAVYGKLGILGFLSPALRDEVQARSMPPVLQTNTAGERVTAFADHHIPSRCTYYAILAARHGLAVSFPLLDRRVVEFVLSLPAHLFLADGFSRQPFRRAMRGVLPDRVRLAQSKVGLYDQRFLDYAPRRDALLALVETLRATSPAAVAMFDLDAIAAGIEQLPGPDACATHATAGRAMLARGVPVWLPLMAVQCLIAAHRLSIRANDGDR